MRCEEKYRSRLLSNIVLTGGNSLFPGFDLRLEAELVKLLPDNLSKYVKVNAQPGRENFTWKGGVHLCSLDSFQGLWLTKQDYMETGGSDVQETTVLEQEVESTCESQILWENAFKKLLPVFSWPFFLRWENSSSFFFSFYRLLFTIWQLESFAYNSIVNPLYLCLCPKFYSSN